MQKSGSGWLFNMVNDSIVHSGGCNIRDLRHRFHLGWLIKQKNCQIGVPAVWKLALLYLLHLRGHRFCVKTHQAVGHTVGALPPSVVRVVYSYRDPRDVLVSLLDHGKKIRSAGMTHTFAALDSFEKALYHVERECRVWQKMQRVRGVVQVSYEALLGDTPGQLQRVTRAVGIDLDSRQIKAVVQNYEPEQLDAVGADMLHLNKAQAGRFRSILTPQQQEQARSHLLPWLSAMGYTKQD
jgi:hypothetical protein